MEINQLKKVKTNAKTVRIHCEVSDRFAYVIEDEQGETIHSQDDGYVPDFMPGQHYGACIILDINIDTGVIKNWKKLTSSDIEMVLKAEADD